MKELNLKNDNILRFEMFLSFSFALVHSRNIFQYLRCHVILSLIYQLLINVCTFYRILVTWVTNFPVIAFNLVSCSKSWLQPIGMLLKGLLSRYSFFSRMVVKAIQIKTNCRRNKTAIMIILLTYCCYLPQ